MQVLSISSCIDWTFYFKASIASYFQAVSQASGPNYAFLSQCAQAVWLVTSGELD